MGVGEDHCNKCPPSYLTASGSPCTQGSLIAGKNHHQGKVGMMLESAHVAGGKSAGARTSSVQTAQAGGTSVCRIPCNIIES